MFKVWALQYESVQMDRQSNQVSLLTFFMDTDLHLPFIYSGPHVASPTSRVTYWLWMIETKGPHKEMLSCLHSGLICPREIL